MVFQEFVCNGERLYDHHWRWLSQGGVFFLDICLNILQTFDPEAKGASDSKRLEACRALMKGQDTEGLSNTSICAAVFGLWVTTMLDTIEAKKS